MVLLCMSSGLYEILCRNAKMSTSGRDKFRVDNLDRSPADICVDVMNMNLQCIGHENVLFKKKFTFSTATEYMTSNTTCGDIVRVS